MFINSLNKKLKENIVQMKLKRYCLIRQWNNTVCVANLIR